MYQLINNKNNACDTGNIKADYLHFGFDIGMISWK